MTSGLISKININVIRVREVFMTDKKREGDLIHFVLLRSIGEAFFKPMKIENLEKHLQEWADSFIKI
jgi:3-dehydroquinate synthetase